MLICRMRLSRIQRFSQVNTCFSFCAVFVCCCFFCRTILFSSWHHSFTSWYILTYLGAVHFVAYAPVSVDSLICPDFIRLRHTRWSRQAISAFAAAATTAALVYCQSLQAAPMVPEARKGQNTSIHTKPFKHCLLICMTSMNIMNSITCLGNTFDVSFLDVLWECVSYKLETHWA